MEPRQLAAAVDQVILEARVVALSRWPARLVDAARSRGVSVSALVEEMVSGIGGRPRTGLR